MRRNKGLLLPALALLALAIVAGGVYLNVLFGKAEVRGQTALVAPTSESDGPAVPDATPTPPVPPETSPTEVLGPREDLLTLFQADANGRLVLSPTTRLNLEKLHALNTPEDFLAKLQRLSVVLPATAHAELLKLAASYLEYTDAVQEAFPPEASIETVAQAEAELKGIHELRVKHFGPAVTEAFFGEEERMSRRLIELMALEADDSLPLAEKAHRAQQMLQAEQQQSPGGPAPHP